MEPIFIKEFLPTQLFNVINSYCIIKYTNKSDFVVDPQTSSLVREYGDYLMETILDMSTPVIEKNVGKKLWPTYSYVRIYDKGDNLKVHLDRPSCEYTVALCLGADPLDKPYDIFIGQRDENSNYKYYDWKDNYIPLNIEHKFSMLPNNGIIFKGMEKLHWREYCKHDHFITVFLHYVDQEGEYKEFKYDKRHVLGAPQKI